MALIPDAANPNAVDPTPTTALLTASGVPAFLLRSAAGGPAIAFANPALATLTGSDADELVGRPVSKLLGKHADRAVSGMLEDALAGGRAFEADMLCTRADGASYWGRVHLAPYGDGHVGQIVDVTRRVDAEGALALSQQREALGLLTNSVAHEFNNFLQILIGYIDGLKRRLGDRPEPFVQRALVRSTEAAERAAVLTRQLLSYSRRIAPEVRPVALDALVAAIGPDLRRSIPARIAFEVGSSGPLPAALCNPHQVELALRALVANAVEAIAGEGTIEIATFAVPPGDRGLQRPDEGAVGIAVRDDGPGMSPEMQTRALVPFATSHEAGRGAGLAIVHGLMKRQSGTISLESRPGLGTTIRLVFPVGA